MYKFVAITNMGNKFEQLCNSIKEGNDLHKRLIDAGWNIVRYAIFKLDSGPEVQMHSNLH